jgi:hypothetical protein
VEAADRTLQNWLLVIDRHHDVDLRSTEALPLDVRDLVPSGNGGHRQLAFGCVRL